MEQLQAISLIAMVLLIPELVPLIRMWEAANGWFQGQTQTMKFVLIIRVIHQSVQSILGVTLDPLGNGTLP